MQQMNSTWGAKYQEEKAQQNLKHYVDNFKIFIDTCSLLHFASDKFWMNIVPLLQCSGNKVIIPSRAIDELEKHKGNTAKPELAEKAKNTLIVVAQLQKAQLVELRGEATDNFVDNVFLVVFTKFRMTHQLLLITQDSDLAKDIQELNDAKSVKANKVFVKRINQYGYLSNYHWEQSVAIQKKPSEIQAPVVAEEPNYNDKFELSKTITVIQDDLLKVSFLPGENDTVYTSRGSVQLVDTVAAGGEGIVYTTNTSYIAKIYKKEKITKRKYEKIKLMLSKEVKCDGICYPVDCLYNQNKEFIGYLMPQAKGKELQRSLFIKPLLLRNFPGWKKRDTVELCITILQKIKYLHDRNILIGDINPANILVVSPREIYFVDTDSYQIQGFPCPVGTINYTAPEIQRKNFGSFLRTIGNENFAVATLLFMIMLPGKPPYSHLGGESPIDNLSNMDFSYPFGEQSNKKTPDGPWRFIWSHLTYDLKSAFYNTFIQGGENSEEATRLSIAEWLPLFSYYRQLLDTGKFGAQDPMSEELFPTRFKKVAGITYVKCTLCGNEVGEEQCKNGFCRECLNKGEIYNCIKCGKEILFSNYNKYIKGAKKHDMCPDCFEYGRAVRLLNRCVDCGKKFEITNSQYDFYKSKGFDVPKRCEVCRAAKKKRSYKASNMSFESSSSRTRGCFISTVVCEYLGKPDSCEELTILRSFRDNWLSLQPDGRALIDEYYASAPLLVSKLRYSHLKDYICKLLWEEYITPCLRMIKEHKMQDCKHKYIDMVHYLSHNNY